MYIYIYIYTHSVLCTVAWLAETFWYLCSCFSVVFSALSWTASFWGERGVLKMGDLDPETGAVIRQQFNCYIIRHTLVTPFNLRVQEVTSTGFWKLARIWRRYRPIRAIALVWNGLHHWESIRFVSRGWKGVQCARRRGRVINGIHSWTATLC